MAFELFDLKGKRALVTGSSQAIGLALAQRLAEHGAEIVLNGRDAAKLDAAAGPDRTWRHNAPQRPGRSEAGGGSRETDGRGPQGNRRQLRREARASHQ